MELVNVVDYSLVERKNLVVEAVNRHCEKSYSHISRDADGSKIRFTCIYEAGQ